MQPNPPGVPLPASERLSQVVLEALLDRRWRKWLALGILLVVLGYLAYLVREVWIPLAIAFVIAMVLDPSVDRMERRGWSRLVASALIFASFVVVLAITLVVTVPIVTREAQGFQRRFEQVLPDRSPAGIRKSLEKTTLSPTAKEITSRAIQGGLDAAKGTGKWLSTHTMEVASNLVWLVIIPIVAFYALKDFHLILAKMLLLVPKHRRDFVQTMLAETTAVFGKYMRATLLVSFLNGLTTYLVLIALGTPSALLLGLLAAVFYTIPYIGAVLTVATIGVVAFVAKGPDFMILNIGANIILHQVIFDNIVAPRILGGHVGLHPILAIFALLVGNVLLGLVGMVIAVPVAACVQIAVLAMVPKLQHEIDLSASEDEPTAHTISEQTKDQHEQVNATEQLHGAVHEAVENIEAQVRAEDGEPARKAS